MRRGPGIDIRDINICTLVSPMASWEPPQGLIRPTNVITSSVNGSVSISLALTRAVNIHVCFLTLRRHLGRQGRCGDCRVGDKVVVVIVDSTAICAAPGALTVAARAYPPNWLFTLPLPLILNLHIYFHLALRQQLRVLNIMLNGLYLYQWLYVDSCFIHCNYQSIKHYS